MTMGIYGFMNVPSFADKMFMFVIFLLLATIFLFVGLAVMKFRNWKRDAGIVLLSVSAYSLFGVIVVASIFVNKEFRKMIEPEVLSFFTNYITGFGVIIWMGAIGAVLIKASKRDQKAETRPTQIPSGEDAGSDVN